MKLHNAKQYVIDKGNSRQKPRNAQGNTVHIECEQGNTMTTINKNNGMYIPVIESEFLEKYDVINEMIVTQV